MARCACVLLSYKSLVEKLSGCLYEGRQESLRVQMILYFALLGAQTLLYICGLSRWLVGRRWLEQGICLPHHHLIFGLFCARRARRGHRHLQQNLCYLPFFSGNYSFDKKKVCPHILFIVNIQSVIFFQHLCILQM